MLIIGMFAGFYYRCVAMCDGISYFWFEALLRILKMAVRNRGTFLFIEPGLKLK
jgi:hypothetical protein